MDSESVNVSLRVPGMLSLAVKVGNNRRVDTQREIMVLEMYPDGNAYDVQLPEYPLKQRIGDSLGRGNQRGRLTMPMPARRSS